MIVWLASYPRSGNTFLRIILHKKFGINSYSVYDDKSDIGADGKTANIVGHRLLPENFDVSKFRKYKRTYYIKTHELPDECVSEEDLVIYLLRDGRESLKSLVKYMQKYGRKDTELQDVINGQVFGGSWGEHVSAWFPKTRSNCLLIKYEDLVQSTSEQVKLLSDFLSIGIKDKRVPDFKHLQKINPDFFSSGKCDSWKQMFSKEDNCLFWLKNYKQMKSYGYVDTMPEVFKSEINVNLFRAISDENKYLLEVYQKRQCEINAKFETLTLEKHRAAEEVLREKERFNKVEIERDRIAEEVSREKERFNKLEVERNRIAEEALREKEQLFHIVENKTKESCELQEQLDCARIEVERIAEEQLQENERLNSIIENLNKESSELWAQFSSVRNEIEQKNSMLKSKNDECNQLISECNVMQENLNSVHEKNKNLRGKCGVLEEELSKAKCLVEELLNSKRWKYASNLLSIFGRN